MTGYQWTQRPSMPFTGRDGPGLIAGKFGGSTEELWLYGGWNSDALDEFPTKTCNQIIRCDNIITGAWSMRRKFGQFLPRHCFGVVEDFSGALNIYGSDSQAGRYISDHWASGNRIDFKLEGDACPWGPRILGIPCRFGDDILMIGGQTLPAYVGPGTKLIAYTDIWKWQRNNADQGPWRQASTDCPALPRGMVDKAVEFQGELWLFTGGIYGPPHTYDTKVWKTVGRNLKNWIEVPTIGEKWCARGYANVAAWDGKLWVVGGYSEATGNLGDTWFSDDGARWHKLAQPIPPRHAAGLVVYQDKLTLVAGNGAPMKNDVWQLARA